MQAENMTFREYSSHKVLNYMTRLVNAPAAYRAAFFVLAASYLNAVLSVAAALIAGIWLMTDKRRIKRILSDSINLIAFIFIGMTVIVAVFNRNWVGLAASVFFTCLMIIMMNLRAVINRRLFEDLITCHLCYSVFSSLIAIIQKLFHLNDPLFRSDATFLNPLYYSYFIALGAVMCTYRLVVSPRAKAAHLTVLLINLVGMFCSGGRMPWMGMFIGCLAVLVLCRRYKLLLLFLAAIAALVAFAALFPDIKMLSALRLGSLDDGYNERIPYWHRALDGFFESPIAGKGFLGVLNGSIGENADLFRRFFETFDLNAFFADMKSRGWMLHAHNFLFDMLCNFGIVGSALFAFCIIRYLSKMYRRFEYRSSQPMIALMVGFICTVGVNSVLDCQYIGLQTAVFTMIFFSATGLKKERAYDDNRPELTMNDIRKFLHKHTQR